MSKPPHKTKKKASTDLYKKNAFFTGGANVEQSFYPLIHYTTLHYTTLHNTKKKGTKHHHHIKKKVSLITSTYCMFPDFLSGSKERGNNCTS